MLRSDHQDSDTVNNNCDAATMPEHPVKPSDTPNMSNISASVQPVNMSKLTFSQSISSNSQPSCPFPCRPSPGDASGSS